MRFASHAELPLFGKARSTTVSTSLVEIHERDGGLRQTHRVCDVRFEGGVPGVRIEMPPGFVAALGTHAYPIALTWEDGGWRYQADLGVEYVGWRADDSAPLPEREPTAAEIRLWATENGIACPAKGRVPKAVRAAYDEWVRRGAAPGPDSP